MAMADDRTPADIARYRGFRQDEVDAANLYRAMADNEDRAENRR